MTIYDIAKKAGVSASSVSRVVNNKPGVNPETREKIKKLLKDGIDFPLVNYFTADWSAAEELGGFKLNSVEPEYLSKADGFLPPLQLPDKTKAEP